MMTKLRFMYLTFQLGDLSYLVLKFSSCEWQKVNIPYALGLEMGVLQKRYGFHGTMVRRQSYVTKLNEIIMQ